MVLPLAAVGWLFVASHDLAAVRVAGVSLGWWAMGAAYGLMLVALALRPRAGGATRDGQ